MGKPKRSSKIRQETMNNDVGDMGSGGEFFGLLNLKPSKCFDFHRSSLKDI